MSENTIPSTTSGYLDTPPVQAALLSWPVDESASGLSMAVARGRKWDGGVLVIFACRNHGTVDLAGGGEDMLHRTYDKMALYHCCKTVLSSSMHTERSVDSLVTHAGNQRTVVQHPNKSYLFIYTEMENIVQPLKMRSYFAQDDCWRMEMNLSDELPSPPLASPPLHC